MRPFLALPVLLAIYCVFSPTTSGGGNDAPYDLLIKNGKIVDGTGNPWYYGDVAVRGSKIVGLGKVPLALPNVRSTPRDSSSRQASSTCTPIPTSRF